MSQRLGMADGRCLTISMSNQLLTEAISKNLGVNVLDSGKLRHVLMSKDPESLVEAYLPKQPCGIRNLRD